ncbi:MAG: flavin reductase family protein [Bacteroidales bacterium]|nr:flavin reductase family protein [Clostridium sp.]MCM1203402.1 flavin reductase family protein [Bacteroidales bacterium]
MGKQSWKPGNMLYPVPAVLVSCRDKAGKDNVLTVAWAGTICSEPAMLSISVRKERYSHRIIKESGEFVVNLTTGALAYATDYCGVKSGRDEDKFAAAKLTRGEAEKVNAPIIMESPVNIECRVKQVLELGSHDLFLAEVVNVQISDEYMDEKGAFHLNDADLLAYSHGQYYELGKKLGTFGYSVRKKTDTKKRG